MSIGSFDDTRRTFRLETPLAPRPWINYLGYDGLKAFVSQRGGGLLWLLEPYTRRISRYHYTAPPGDQPGFYVYVRDHETGALWNPHFAPTCTPLDTYGCEHRPGVTVLSGTKDGLAVSVGYTIPPKENILLWRVTVRNKSNEKKTATLASYLEFGLLEFMREAIGWCYLKNQLGFTFDPEAEILRYDYHVFEAPDCPRMAMACTEPVAGWECARDAFIGPVGSLERPNALLGDEGFSNSELPDGGHGCGALGVDLSLEPGEEHTFAYLFATGADWDATDALLNRYRTPGAVDNAFARTDAWWNERLTALQVHTACKEMDRFVNTWNPLNAMITLNYARTISTDHMGTDGLRFRDTSQDALSVAHLDPQRATASMEAILAQQTSDGGGCFAFYPHTDRATTDAPHRSDNGVWPVYTYHALLAETGDTSLLDHTVPYRDSGSATVYEHLKNGLEHIYDRRGPHGLPTMFHADWNDGLALFGDEQAESVMLGQQLVYACRLFADFARQRDDDESAAWCESVIDELDTILNSDDVWDGAWYRRLLLSDGGVVGSAANPQGQIYLNPQSWSVISGTDGGGERGRLAMDAVRQRLDTDYGVLILDPPFRGFPTPADPPLGSNPGIGENGGVFCHANTWAILAECLLGRAEQAFKYYHQLLPEMVIQRVGIERYQREPYAYLSSLVGRAAKTPAQGGISWLTGTASWMYIAATQYLLGIHPTLEGLHVRPCLPPSVPRATVTRQYRGATYRIEIRNEGAPAPSLEIDGTPLKDTLLRPAEKGTHTVLCLC